MVIYVQKNNKNVVSGTLCKSIENMHCKLLVVGALWYISVIQTIGFKYIELVLPKAF